MTRRPAIHAIGLECKVADKIANSAGNDRPVFHVQSRGSCSRQASWCQKLLSGEKSIELRAYALPKDYLGAPLTQRTMRSRFVIPGRS